MKLSRVRRVLTKRLAWLTAKAEGAPKWTALAEEREALETLLRCQGMLEPEQLVREVTKCEGRVLPAEQRTKAQARRGNELVGQVHELVVELQRVVGAAC